MSRVSARAPPAAARGSAARRRSARARARARRRARASSTRSSRRRSSARVGVQVVVAGRGRGDRRARGAPSTSPASATATARLSSTTGEPVRRASSPYRAAIRGQSGGSSTCSAASAACSTYGPRPPSASARSSAARPAAIWSWSQSERSCSRSRTSAPSAKRASRRASLSSISASSAVHLGLVGHQLGERAPEPDRLRRELAATAVALVEDQVHDREHRGEAVGQQVGRRDAERDPGRPDLALRAHEPLRHRRLGDEERARDLVRPEPAQRAQRQRDLGIERERRMTAGEDELEPLVGDRRLVHGRPRCCAARRAGGSSRASVRSRRMRSIARLRAVVTSQARGWAGVTVPRPALGGDRERLLGGLLGELEVAEEADQAGEDASPLVAEDLLEDRYRSTTGRTSTAPPRRAAGMRDASSIAESRSSASKNR